MKDKIQCTPTKADGTGSAAPTAGCFCGSDQQTVTDGKFCGIKGDGKGIQLNSATCPAAKTDGLSTVGTACNCGTEGVAAVTATQYCLVTTGVTTPPAYKTGCSVASVASASRRTYAVTFTATVAPAQASAATTASGSLTTAQ